MGDAQAIDMLVRTFTAPLYRLALSILDDREDAEEAVQDTFVQHCANWIPFVVKPP